MKNFGNSSRGRSQGVPKISRAPTYRAHYAVIFAIAQLSHEVPHWLYISKFTRLRAVSRRQHGSCLRNEGTKNFSSYWQLKIWSWNGRYRNDRTGDNTRWIAHMSTRIKITSTGRLHLSPDCLVRDNLTHCVDGIYNYQDCFQSVQCDN